MQQLTRFQASCSVRATTEGNNRKTGHFASAQEGETVVIDATRKADGIHQDSRKSEIRSSSVAAATQSPLTAHVQVQPAIHTLHLPLSGTGRTGLLHNGTREHWAQLAHCGRRSGSACKVPPWVARRALRRPTRAVVAPVTHAQALKHMHRRWDIARTLAQHALERDPNKSTEGLTRRYWYERGRTLGTQSSRQRCMCSQLHMLLRSATCCRRRTRSRHCRCRCTMATSDRSCCHSARSGTETAQHPNQSKPSYTHADISQHTLCRHFASTIRATTSTKSRHVTSRHVTSGHDIPGCRSYSTRHLDTLLAATAVETTVRQESSSRSPPAAAVPIPRDSTHSRCHTATRGWSPSPRGSKTPVHMDRCSRVTPVPLHTQTGPVDRETSSR